MYALENNGTLTVAYHTRDTREIDSRLKALDPSLFLDPEFDPTLGCVYWTVKFWNGERAPEPVSPILEWRDGYGHPKPVTEAIVHEVQRMMRRGPISIKQIAEDNRQLRKRRRDDAEETYRDIVTDFERHSEKRIMVDRSVGLRMSRDKLRARGAKV